MSFDLVFEPVRGKSDRIKTYHGYNFSVIDGDDRRSYRILAGFTFDGASIPRFLWSTVGHPMSPRYLEAGLIHDYLYRTGKESRKIADYTFYKMLRHWGVPRWRAWLMWAGVRAFGFAFYNRCNRKQK